ncbi:MAG: SDR family NAD(P)-dependent oxidoreductase [Oscillospiraceae bacterium]|nr:SDR family NAD(P)-dependent oxidoreductase [Oscillospiraceae bacterium]
MKQDRLNAIENKTIVLTGASSGIGLEVLRQLAWGKGNRILAVARHVDNLSDFARNVTPFACDISTREGVDLVFEKAEELFGKIDLFYANAGFPYYEEFNYTDWERVDAMFRTNTISPIYTYAKYIKHLNGRPGVLAYTISAIGEMAMPGYAIYSSSKFALNGFQQAIRLEKPDNLQITCLYPVATDTNFFHVANPVSFEKPFPVQKPSHVAKKMIRGIEDGKARVSPSGLFGFAKILMGVVPPVRTVYWKLETAKLERFKEKLNLYGERLQENMKTAVEKGREVSGALREREQVVRRDLEGKAAKMREEWKDKRHGGV